MKPGGMLRGKIIFGILLILLISLTSTGFFFIDGQRKRLLADLEERGRQVAALVADFSVAPIEKFSFFILEEVALGAERSPRVAFCEIYDENGESLVQIETRVHGRILGKKRRRTGSDILIIEEPIMSKNGMIGKVEIGLFLDPVRKEIRKKTIQLGFAILVVLAAVAVAINIFLSIVVISPVERLFRATRSLARGEFIRTDTERRNDEIGELARSFNQMSGALEHLYQNLENEVEERTSELASANRRLKKEIRERRKTEEELKKARDAAESANRYKSMFLAYMSHEIRTPLNAVLGYSQILQRRKGMEPDVKNSVDAIERSGGHLLGMINDILDLSKIEAGRVELRPAPMDLFSLLGALSDMFQLRCREKRLTWTVRGPAGRTMIPVMGDQGKLRQVLINLLSNAVNFTRQGGVTLSLDALGDDRFRFEAADTGPGISESVQPIIFKPFRQARGGAGKGGTGLGLYIARMYIELMGGTLEIDSRVGWGARFFFTLTLPPASPEQLAPRSEERKIKRVAEGCSVRALIVDDVFNNRAVLSKVLTEAGVEVEETGNGRTAVEIARGKAPDIIFMDRHMPGMDGMETSRAIRSASWGKEIKIVIITADAFCDEIDPDGKAGVDDVIIKPFRVEEILNCMSSLLSVPFEYEEEEAVEEARIEAGPDAIPAFTGLRPPGELVRRLMEAAEFCEISEIKKLLAELRAEGERENELSDHLESLLKKYDMDGIVRILGEFA